MNAHRLTLCLTEGEFPFQLLVWDMTSFPRIIISLITLNLGRSGLQPSTTVASRSTVIVVTCHSAATQSSRHNKETDRDLTKVCKCRKPFGVGILVLLVVLVLLEVGTMYCYKILVCIDVITAVLWWFTWQHAHAMYWWFTWQPTRSCYVHARS